MRLLKIKKHSSLNYFALSGFVVIFAALGIAFLFRSHADSCTPTSILVNPCRPWLGGFANGYPETGSDSKSQLLYQEQRQGRQNDVVHTYHALNNNALTATDVYFATRPNTILFTNWKPVSKWANVSSANAAIDSMANSIKALGSTKIMLTLWHEPENDVTPGGDPNCTTLKYVGSAGTVADYRNMWAYVENRFATDGVTNVVWVMDYMSYSGWDCLVPDLYPGDNLVDWVVFDPYGAQSGTPDFVSDITRFSNVLTADTDATHSFTSKPWGFGEWGIGGNTTANDELYYDQAKAALDNNTFPNIKLYMIFDSPSGNWNGRVGYDDNGTVDPAKGAHYYAFANDSLLTNAYYQTQTTPLSVSLLTPTDGQTVSGNVNISGSASDSANITKVEVYVDGSLTTTLTTSPYSYSWDSTTAPDGSHSIYMIAYDDAGAQATSNTVSVNVANQAGDTTPPVVSINNQPVTSPVKGTLEIDGTATDNVAVASVTMSVDGSYVATSASTTSPYVFNLDTTQFADGSHTIQLQAVDTSGNKGQSANYPITIQNTVAAPTAPSNLAATAVASNKVNLTWSASTSSIGIAGYYVERDGVVIAQVTGTSYSDTTVAPNTTYGYSVVAYDTANTPSQPSATASVTTPNPPDTTAPTAPATVAASVASPTQVNLTWAASTDNVGVAGYNVLRNGSKIATVNNTTSFGDATATAGTQYTYAVQAFDAAGNVSTQTAATTVKTQPNGPSITNGLSATYYPNQTMTGLGISRTDSSVNFNWGTSSPLNGIPASGYSVRWSGRVYAQSSGTYTFSVYANDGAQLSVNGMQIINDWTTHAAKQDSGTITLTAGQWYNVDLTHFDNSGSASTVFSWSGPGIASAVLPTTAFSNAHSGLLGNYYKGTNFNTLVFNRTDNTVNFSWGTGAPSSQLPVNGFSIHWTGMITVPTTGKYTFYTNTDDGVRLSVGGTQLINKWINQAARTYSGSISLTGGTTYPIAMDYYENTNTANAQLLWSGPNITKTVIPTTVLIDR